MEGIGERYDNFFTQGHTLERNGRVYGLSVARAGIVTLPSGTVVACDPLMNEPGKPFVQTVLPGRYPVDLALARTAGEGERIAMARIAFTSRRPSVWVAALRKGESHQSMRKGQIPGYFTASGTGCFMDGELAKHADVAGADDIDQLLADLTENYRPQRFWREYAVDRRNTIVMFSTGEGEGTYGSYFGIDEAGDMSVLVTDFRAI